MFDTQNTDRFTYKTIENFDENDKTEMIINSPRSL